MRLVNLTEHQIVVDVRPCRTTGDGQGSIPSSVLQIPQTGEFGSSEVPWAAFPAAEAIADWIEQQAAAQSGSVIQIAGGMPQKIAVGSPLQLRQQSATWPAQVCPVNYSGGCLTAPSPDLRRGSVPAEHW